jgi:hypothetical protein
MDWFYAENGQQAGPVSEADLDNLQRSGRIAGSTLVWRAGMTDWQPLEKVRPSANPGVPPAVSPAGIPPVIGIPPAGAAVCAECRREFPQSEMIFLNRSWVCANCKPIFVQRLKEGAGPAGGDVWRDGRQFVLAVEGTELPDRCVKCNVPVNGSRLKRRLMWHHPAVYLLIFLNLLIYAIVALCIRKRATIQIGVCPRHRSERVWTIAGSWAAALLGIVLFGFGVNSSEALCWLGGLLFVGGAIYGFLRGPMVAAGRIGEDFVWVRGGGRAFLESLPDWPGSK